MKKIYYGSVWRNLFSKTMKLLMVKKLTVCFLLITSLSVLASQAQQKNLTGTVTGEDGMGIPGVSIMQKGTTNGTATDIDGNYALSNVPDNATLVLTFVGMESQEVEVGNRTSIDITMQVDAVAVEEVVIVGYGTQKRENLTSAVSVVNTALLEDRITDSPANLLYGLASGVTVTSQSGMPGGSAVIQVRESGSYQTLPDNFRTGSGNDVLRDYNTERSRVGSPLFVIDGTIRTAEDFSNLNAPDIESITVLKDAASTAIYGMRGGDGVILVTTRRGKAGEPTINYTMSYSTSEPTIDLEYFNAYELSVRDNYMFDYQNQPADYIGRYSPDELDFYKNNSYSIFDQFWENPTTTKHNVSISGGNEDTRYYVSGSMLDNEGALNNSFKKNTFLTRLDGKITDDLSFTVTLNGSEAYSKSNYDASAGRGSTGYGLVRDLNQHDPRDPGLINGDPTTPTMSGLLFSDYQQNSTKAVDVLLKGELVYKIPWVDGLSLKGSYVHQNRNNYNRIWKGQRYQYHWLTTGTNNHIYGDLDVDGPLGERSQIGNGYNGFDHRLQEETQRFTSHQSNISLNYVNTFGKHNVAAFVGLEESANDGRNLYTVTNGFIDPTSDYNGASNGFVDLNNRWIGGEVLANTAISSAIGRLDYNFAQKYILGFTMRADRSYKFDKDNQVGYFPAASAGWNIHKESFFNTSGIVNKLKLRASYGLTGSDNTAAWQYLNTFSIRNGGEVIDGLKPQKLIAGVVANPLITWEKNYSSNIGVDATFFDNLLDVSFDAWNRRTEDILDTRIAVIPTTAGASLPAVNYAEGKSWGYDLSAGHSNRVGELNYSVNLVWGKRDSEFITKDQAGNTRPQLNQIGQPMFGKLFGFISEGVIRTPADLARIYAENGVDFKINGRAPKLGDLMYKDTRGNINSDTPNEPDGQVNNDDREILSWKGTPGNTYGFNFSFDYKSFNLNLVTQGVYNYEGFMMNGATSGSSKLWGQTMWTPDNPETGGPIPVSGGNFALGSNTNVASSNRENSTYWLRDLSYLRMKSITLSYRVPEKIAQATKVLKGIRLFVGVENPFYIYNAVNDLSVDPELGGGGNYMSYPIMRTFSGGLNVTF